MASVVAAADKPQKEASANARQMGMFRTLAREEQKKVQRLRAAGGAPDAIKAAEARVQQLTERMAKLGKSMTADDAGSAAADKAREARARRKAEVHLDLSEEEMKAWLEQRERENVAAGKPKHSRATKEATGPCSVCFVPTSKKSQTGRTISFFCSPKCQRDGWRGHLDRVRRDELAARKQRQLEEDMRREDAGWDAETRAKLEDPADRVPDVDFLGVARGRCYDTGCVGYVQQRGAPRNIKPRAQKDGCTVESGIWSWNRVDHLACRRCGAPAGAHEDLTEELKKRNRRATAGLATARNDGGRASRLSKGKSGGLSSEYYYAHKAGVDHRAAPAPRRLDGVSESSSDDEAVEFIGGSKQVKTQKGKGDSDYYYAHRPENYVTKVEMPPEKLG